MAVTGLSHPRAITCVPDPVHGVIDLTIFDRDIVDTRAFQRLHFVLQQSVNYTSFPSNKNSRFPHSLGTAHLSGRLFSSALSNAETRVLKSFLQQAGDFLDKLIDHCWPHAGGVGAGDPCTYHAAKRDVLLRAHVSTISGMSKFLHAPQIKVEKKTRDGLGWRVTPDDIVKKTNALPTGFIIDTFWQALRVYALAHDIGHLPMSHAFEEAVGSVGDGLKEFDGGDSLGDEFDKLLDKAKDRFSGMDRKKEEPAFFDLLKKMLGVSKKRTRDYIQYKGKAIHEIRGFAILNNLIAADRRPISDCFPDDTKGKTDGLAADEKQAMDEYGRFIHNLALCIIYSPCIAEFKKGEKRTVRPNSFLFALNALVDGEIDGDRLDYTLRDSHEAGSQFGKFNLEMIVRNAILVQAEKHKCKPGDKDRLFSFGYGPRSVAGIEQFFEARYQSYKYQVHHRTASRSNTVVENLIEKIFVYSTLYPESDCAEILNRHGYIRLGGKHKNVEEILPVMTETIERMDDADLRSLLHEVREKFQDPKNRNYLAPTPERLNLAKEISVLCDIALFRENGNIVTLFKEHTVDEFFEKEIGIANCGDREAFRASIEEDFGEFSVELRSAVKRDLEAVGQGPVTLMYELIKPKVFLENDPTISNFERHVWICRPHGLMSLGNRKVSATLAGMAIERSYDRSIRLYVAGDDLKKSPEVIKTVRCAIIGSVKKRLKDEQAGG